MRTTFQSLKPLLEASLDLLYPLVSRHFLVRAQHVDEGTQITGTLQSLALSNDKELLSITTESDITVYNLISNVSTPLNVRHLPAAFGRSAFHPLRRTTLITICGKQLVVFDSNKPTSPPKVVALSPMSRVVDMAFIPSGKGLLAAANERGGVYIVDIEKDKPLVIVYFYGRVK